MPKLAGIFIKDTMTILVSPPKELFAYLLLLFVVHL